MIINAGLLKERMNRYGSKGLPFICGVDFELSKGFFISDPMEANDILWEINGVGNHTVVDAPRRVDGDLLTVTGADGVDSYSKRFDVIRSGLLRGDSFLTNLTVATKVETPLTLKDIFERSSARYKLLIPNEFVCFSPEIFVKISHDNSIHTYPMKGTIDATLPNAEQTLMDDYKELCEHNTIVDLLRNDLSMVANHVRVRRFRYVEKLATDHGDILQTSSEITGNLGSDWHRRLGDIIFSLLPAGSVSGAPKPATLRLIREAEEAPRGWYSGIMGYYDGYTFDSAVMIRCIEQRKEGLYFHSGGGITVNSDMQSEYDEVLQKVYLPIK
jgi:para-aminobenzoate synthetase component 1